MPCPHNQISIVQRSNRQSAVAAAAYQSGEKLFCEYDQQVKHYPEKRGIVHNEILLPANAPPEYADRNTLWNAAEAVEKQYNENGQASLTMEFAGRKLEICICNPEKKLPSEYKIKTVWCDEKEMKNKQSTCVRIERELLEKLSVKETHRIKVELM